MVISKCFIKLICPNTIHVHTLNVKNSLNNLYIIGSQRAAKAIF